MDNSVDVDRADPPVDESLKTAGSGIQENTAAFTCLKKMAGRSAASMVPEPRMVRRMVGD